MGDREAPQGRQGPWTGGLLLLEEGEASGVPHDLHHHDQRRQGAGEELNLRSMEAFLRFVERHLGGPLGLMKIFKLR